MARKKTSTKKSTLRKGSSTRNESPVAKRQKPVFSTGTLITVLLALLLGLYAFYLNREKKNAEAEATPAGEEVVYVFGAESGNVTSIEVKPAEGEVVKLKRNAENVWVLELPIKTEADQGLAEAAASQVFALKIVSEVDIDPSDLGLDDPAYLVLIEFADETPALAGGATEAHTLEVGDSTPTNSGYYVRVDKDKIMILSLSGIDSLINLVTFPPYLNTPTPTPLPPTETPVPPTEAISTLEAPVTVTPTP